MTAIRFVGDLILDAPEPDTFFEPAAAELRDCDLLIGHVEIPHTLHGEEISTDVAAPPTSPENLAALGRAGFHVATLAGNHIADRGAAGVVDTIAALQAQGIAVAGAGVDLDRAWEPALVHAEGASVGVLSVNCVGPDVAKATSAKPGAAYLDIHTVYGPPFGGPGGAPMSVQTFADRSQLARLERSVAALRAHVDIVVVALHKGILHVPAQIADYEIEVSRAAIDAGADVVVGHHAHILKGIEVYRGRPIFHGLGNFVTVTGAISERPDNSPERRAWARRRREMTGFDPDPHMPMYPFHPQSRNALIAQLELTAGEWRARVVPCWIDEQARPVPVSGDAARAVLDYVSDITRRAGFDTTIDADGVLTSLGELR